MARSLLFSPITVGGIDIPHRLWMPPMCQYSAAASGDELGRPNSWHLVHYGSRAQSGVAAVIVEATGVVPKGRISINCLSLHSDDQIPSFAALATVIHEAGAAAFIQLSHAGRKASGRPMWEEDLGPVPHECGGWTPEAPSSIPFQEGTTPPRQLDEDEVDAIADAFAQAARRAMEAGFDGVQIHGAHGYLIHQFLSPASNTRDDQWGGDFEGRTRFLREIVRRTRASVGSGALMVRLSATDWVEDDSHPGSHSWTLADTLRLAPLLVEDGVDMLNMSTGGNVITPVPAGPGYQVESARMTRQALRDAGLNTPIATVGLIRSAMQAEQILVGGDADVVEIARPLLTDPMIGHVWAGQLRAEATPLPAQYRRGVRRFI
ncbi:NADH:flavin oxidoreductase/NADH oxidase [Schaalia sp. ZJ405]|uniref:oxidoreductase n=1 Tax=Schaalia sp. ZJ405 TaxID=2709403 RepID=UPI0013ED1BA3|nr:NADH:flavin oxidoreductase/NADH oxidase [Schaalia sp. ZJ405]QPK81478.1 NADH:flavin oxidoreductase/NADH oxidase [Schaalia sp. ZJ405]